VRCLKLGEKKKKKIVLAQVCSRGRRRVRASRIGAKQKQKWRADLWGEVPFNRESAWSDLMSSARGQEEETPI